MIALALMMPMARPLATRRVFHSDDLGGFHLPLRMFYSRCLASGDDYRWHPGLYCGFYVHGEGQAGMAHPLHQALYRWLPLVSAFQAEIVLGYPLMLAGMVLWLRRLGLSWEASLFGGLVFAFSPFNLLRYVHPNAVQVIAHLPWLLLAVEALARPRSAVESSMACVGIALLTGSQCLLGYPQYVGLSCLVEISYAACRFGRSRAAWSYFLTAKGLGVLAGGRQIVPHWDALRGSFRHTPSTGWVGTDSLHPLNLLQIVAPELFKEGHYRDDGPACWPRHERVAYLGAVVPASLAWLWMRRKSIGEWRPLVLWAAIMAMASIVLALGKHSPLFPIYARLPLVGLFRATNRFLVVTQLAASTLAAIALHDVAKFSWRGETLPLRSLRVLALPTLLSVAGSGAIKLLAIACPSSFHADQVDALRGLVASILWIAAPAVFFALAARGRRWSVVAIVLVSGLDPAIHVLKPILEHDRPARPEALVGPQPPGPSNARVLGHLNASTPGGTRLMAGYVALSPSRLLDPSDPTTLRVAGASWEWRSAGWRPLDRPLPRARLLTRSRASLNPQADLRRIDPDTIMLSDRNLEFPEGPAGSATIRVDRPGHIVIRTQSPSPRILVVSEAHHPGWTVAVDGRRAEFLPAYGDFLGCVVESGTHDVAFRFHPPSDRLGRLLSWMGLIGIVGLGLVRWVRTPVPLRNAAPFDHALSNLFAPMP